MKKLAHLSMVAGGCLTAIAGAGPLHFLIVAGICLAIGGVFGFIDSMNEE